MSAFFTGTGEPLAFPTPGLRLIATLVVSVRLFRLTIMGFCVLATLSVASAEEPENLLGTWIGERSGNEVEWTLESGGRLRLEGRLGHWSTSHDTLVVEFESLDGQPGTAERAVYRYMASDPRVGHRRLFVYGFDLGAEGLFFTRKVSDEDLARLQAAVKVGGGSPQPPFQDATNAAPSRTDRAAPAAQRP